VLAQVKGFLGKDTNNAAEYNGALAGLKEASKLCASEVELRTDSNLVVQQANGLWQINKPELRVLHAQLMDAAKPFTKATFVWIRRNLNSFADRLANEAMDAAESTTSSSDPPSTIAKTRARRAIPAPQALPAQDQEQPLPEVISIHNKRKKNMRTEYLASVIGTEEKSWIWETKLLPKYKSMILDYGKGPTQPMPSQPPAPAPTLEVKQAPAIALADPLITSPATSLPAHITVTLSPSHCQSQP
jgi:ribonuclease HI